MKTLIGQTRKMTWSNKRTRVFLWVKPVSRIIIDSKILEVHTDLHLQKKLKLHICQHVKFLGKLKAVLSTIQNGLEFLFPLMR